MVGQRRGMLGIKAKDIERTVAWLTNWVLGTRAGGPRSFH